MEEREVHVTHTTIMRWVFRYVPEYEKRWNRRAKPAGSSRRVDETYIHTRPKTGYLYRAVDKEGKNGRLFVPGRAWNRCSHGFFPESSHVLRTSAATKDHARRP